MIKALPYVCRIIVSLSSVFFAMTLSALMSVAFNDAMTLRLDQILSYQKERFVIFLISGMIVFYVGKLFNLFPIKSNWWFLNSLKWTVPVMLVLGIWVYFSVDFKSIYQIFFAVFWAFTNALTIVEITKHILDIPDKAAWHENSDVRKCADVQANHHLAMQKEYAELQLEEEFNNNAFSVNNVYPQSRESTTLLTHSSSPFKNGVVPGEIVGKNIPKHSDKESE